MQKIGIDFFKEFLHPHALLPEGNKVWFLGGQANVKENRYDSDLYTLEEGKVLRRTGSGDVSAFWRVEGETILRSTRNPKDRETIKNGIPLTVLYRLPEVGEAEECLRLDYSVGQIAFLSRDRFLFTAGYNPAYGKAIAQGKSPAEAMEILKADADYQVLTEIPFWSNGRGFTDSLRSRLYCWDKGTVTPITGETFLCQELVLSPDKSYALFCGGAYTDKMPLCNGIYKLDTATLEVTEVTPEKPAVYNTLLPIDEKTALVFYSFMDKYGLNQNSDFGILDMETKAIILLYDGGDFSPYCSVGSDIKVGGPASPQVWVKDGKYYFISTLEEHAYIMEASLSGGAPTPLYKNPGMVAEAALGEQGFVAVLMEEIGGEICRIDAEGVTRCSHINTHLAEEYEIYPPQPLTFINERGTEIHGYIIPPADFNPDKLYPAILDIHGGPRTVYGENFFHEMQFWAANGYAVFFCNPTGGDGRGEAFADIRGQYGQVDYRDLMTFTDKVLEACPWIDAKRVGVTGGSYGGFMTNWIIGHTHRFAAAASQRSIANWLSFYGTTDIGYYFGNDQTGADPWQDAAKMWEQSPMKYADNVTTPTLFIHSDMDYRCWMAEGLQMFTSLKVHGVPARLCLFHGENHELSRSGKPTHRIRRLQEITDWMNVYLHNEE